MALDDGVRWRNSLARGPVVTRVAAAFVLVLTGLVVAAAPAAAHDERASRFPSGEGQVPRHRTPAEAAEVLVVCKPDSAARIASMADDARRRFNLDLLGRCRFQHLQAAVDGVRSQGTNIYVLPGVYREEPSWSPACAEGYDGGVVTYELIVSCGEVLNLVTVAGDDPADEDIACDNALCRLQIEGTGERPGDVLLTGGFREDGDWVKHNLLKADRADGFYLRNMAFELASENAVYVHETDGYVVERVVSGNNDRYGILTFTSDHGRIQDCDTHHNGDSGIYPGSAADVNASRREPGPLNRWSVEVARCDIHHNGVGFAGTAGNSVYIHDNLVHHNGVGIALDSFVSGHPGMPQDHAWIERNRIYANNENYFGNVQGDNAPCHAPRPVDRGHQRGVVCPTVPVPVGTALFFLGGNANLVRNNDIYDNWRYGMLLAWVPGAFRDDFRITAQFDTSHRNQFRDNRIGRHPSGVPQPNGLDVWWDDQGIGNCWQGNVSPLGGRLTSNARRGLPGCGGLGSLRPISDPIKTFGLLPCAQYNRLSKPDPRGCTWLRSPSAPPGRREPPTGHDLSMAPASSGRHGESAAEAAGGPEPQRPEADTATLVPRILSFGAAVLMLGRGRSAWRRRAGRRSAGGTTPAKAPAGVADRRWARRCTLPVLIMTVAFGIVTGAAVGLAPFSSSEATPVSFAAGADVVRLPRLGERSADVLGYRHGDVVSLTFKVTNRSPSPMTVTGIRLGPAEHPLLETTNVKADGRALPATLGPGGSAAVTVTARLANCRYFHEHEAQTFSEALVDGHTFGERFSRPVAFERDLVVRSPMIVGCPDRTLDTDDDVRTATGRRT